MTTPAVPTRTSPARPSRTVRAHTVARPSGACAVAPARAHTHTPHRPPPLQTTPNPPHTSPNPPPPLHTPHSPPHTLAAPPSPPRAHTPAPSSIYIARVSSRRRQAALPCDARRPNSSKDPQRLAPRGARGWTANEPGGDATRPRQREPRVRHGQSRVRLRCRPNAGGTEGVAHSRWHGRPRPCPPAECPHLRRWSLDAGKSIIERATTSTRGSGCRQPRPAPGC
jgi:hypothetical protein